MHEILVVDDSVAIRRLLARRLTQLGYAVREAASAESLSRSLRARKPALVLLDWVLGGPQSGPEVCKRLKSSPVARGIPIVILTGAKTTFDDELQALEQGADLFLTKDVIGSRRLAGYLQALLSRVYGRHADADAPIHRLPGLEIDCAAHVVKTAGRRIANFSTKEFDLLYMLAKAYPRTLSRQRLVAALWKNCVRDREVDVMVSRVRSKLKGAGTQRPLIEAVVGRGYRLHLP